MRFSQEIRLFIFNKFENKCAYCGCVLELRKMQIDHIIPFYHNYFNKTNIKVVGDNELNNLNPSCARCNRWKSNFSLELFRNEIQLQLDRLHKYNNNYKLAKDYDMIKEDRKPIEFWFEKYNKNENRR
jgi:HNH endonuclease